MMYRSTSSTPSRSRLRSVLRLGVLARGIELRRDEDLLARDAAVTQRATDAPLVAVGLRRVDVAISRLRRPPHRVLALAAVGHLPDPEPQQRDRVAIDEHTRASVRRHPACFHRSLLDSESARLRW